MIPVLLLFLVLNYSNAENNNGIVFLSDIQEPILYDKILFGHYRNTEASDSLITDIARLQPISVFLLGDIVSFGTSKKQCRNVNKLLDKVRIKDIEINAIPGNHKYYQSKKKGLKNFLESVPNANIYGYSVVVDSIAVVLINSSELNNSTQMEIYRRVMQEFDKDNGVKFIIVATHHSPYTNSSVVSSDKTVRDSLVPLFISTQKARLFLSGHSHILEHFRHNGKNFVVIGGGGGIHQPLKKQSRREWIDLINNADKPFYFYIRLICSGNTLSVYSRGLDQDLKFFDLKILEI